MTDIRDEARQALEGIHGGPWRVDSGPSGRWVEVANRSTIAEVFAPDPTAEFIAAAPTLVAGLLAELERVDRKALNYREERDSAEEALNFKHTRCDRERAAALATIQQVRELHNANASRRVGFPRATEWERYCTGCGEAAPCTTIRILDGGVS